MSSILAAVLALLFAGATLNEPRAMFWAGLITAVTQPRRQNMIQRNAK